MKLRIKDEDFPVPVLDDLTLAEARHVATAYGVTPSGLFAVDYPDDPVHVNAWAGMCWLALSRAGKRDAAVIVDGLRWNDFRWESEPTDEPVPDEGEPDPQVPADPEPATPASTSPTSGESSPS